jgi:hypothetical protein
MKHFLWAILFAVAATQIHAQQELFKITLEPLWHSLDGDHHNNFGGKWIVVGSINFKKKSNENVQLSNLQLLWKGQKLNNLIASLYKKESNKPFLAIEENLICDGKWDQTRQKLILKFNKYESLHAYDSYYLVLTIPATLESIIAQGSFEIDHALLPHQLKDSILQPLTLSLNNTPRIVH